MTTTTAGAANDFRVGGVIGRSLNLMRQHFVKFVLIAGIALLPVLFSPNYQSSIARIVTAVQHLRSGEAQSVGVERHSVIGWMEILSYLLIAISHPAVIFGAVQSIRGRDFRIGEALRRGIQRSLPVIGVLILVFIIYIVGFILLIVPGVIAQIMFIVAVPVCVVEQAGPIQSLRRSAQLTKGNRWRLFGLLFLIWIVVGIPPIPIQLLLHSIAGSYAAALGGTVYGAASVAFQLVVYAVDYYDLRADKEGIDIETLASVFD